MVRYGVIDPSVSRTLSIDSGSNGLSLGIGYQCAVVLQCMHESALIVEGAGDMITNRHDFIPNRSKRLVATDYLVDAVKVQ